MNFVIIDVGIESQVRSFQQKNANTAGDLYVSIDATILYPNSDFDNLNHYLTLSRPSTHVRSEIEVLPVGNVSILSVAKVLLKAPKRAQ